MPAPDLTHDSPILLQPAAVSLEFTVEQKRRYSPSLQLMLSLLAEGNWYQLALRTGLVVVPGNVKRTLPLPILLRIERASLLKPAAFIAMGPVLSKLGAKVISSWFDELSVVPELEWIPARLEVDATNPARMPDGELAKSRLDKILASGFVSQIALASQHSPNDGAGQSIGDIGLPPDSTYKGKKLTGKGVVIGIIDDGCPFAHQDFLTRSGTAAAPVFHSRTVALWDQSAGLTPTGSTRGWKANYQYGREISGQAIDAALNLPAHRSPQGWLEEERVYEYLSYPLGATGNRSSHGARVMGIAAGNGRATMAAAGVAPEAQIVFVQLPPTPLNLSPAQVTNFILDGVKYVFDYAAAAGLPAVVNLSLGGYAHAHDGSSPWESAMDGLLATPDRCVVVSAGNGFEADCHVSGNLAAGATATWDWLVQPHDPTPNDLEIWYDYAPKVEIKLVAPTGNVHGPYKLGNTRPIPATGAAFGHVSHQQSLDNDDCCAAIWMSPTGKPHPGLPAPPPGSVPAPAGKWTIRVENKGTTAVRFHAWSPRDDLGPSGARRRQSRFDPEKADPTTTIGDLATGRLTISVGAHNVATGEVGGYSAAGPTRPIGNAQARSKPDVMAPAAERPFGRGVLAASSARAQPTRLGGTSAAAPHVAGAAALILEYARHKSVSVTAAQLRMALRSTAKPSGLTVERHQDVARLPKVKQRDVWPKVRGRGKVDVAAALRYLFP